MYFLCLKFILLCTVFSASARNRIHGVGTPMLFPTVMGIAEELKDTKNIVPPFMEVGATGFSFQMFCSGIEDKYPDIVNSSREITEKEKEMCKKNSITYGKIIMEYDAIVIISNKNFEIRNIKLYELFNAISAYVFDKNGNLILNKNTKWKEINPNFPDSKITFYGTTLTSGTYDFLKQKLFNPFCSKTKDSDPLKEYCGLARMDGVYVPVPGGYSLNIQKMLSKQSSIAIVPYSYIEKHHLRFSVISLNGIYPNKYNPEPYLLSRFLYIYYKKNSLNSVKNFDSFIRELKKYSISYDN